MRSFIIFSLAAFVFFSCDEPFNMDADQAPRQVVIEGLVTDQPGRQSVKVSWSDDFYASGNTPRITDATVAVKDDEGQVYPFVHNPNNHADSMGVYVPQTGFVGTVGKTYTLTVNVDGNIFEATDELLSVIPMDSLSYQISDDEVEDPKDEGKIYELLMFAMEPQDVDNFYLFKFYRNDTLTFDNDSDIYYSDDELLAEKIDGVPSPVYYGLNDKAKVEIYSMSRKGYVFYNDLFNILNTDGGMFGPIPSTPRTNLSNGALGFFQVSAVKEKSITIE